MRARLLLLVVALLSVSLLSPVNASTIQLVVTEDKLTGYKRSAFKHWIDADKNGCNTRAEVLIEEAVVKPKIGPKCKLTGGKWLSAYDGLTVDAASQLDVDHMVPLAEAWRSGAWKWSSLERQKYANDLENSEALIAVTLSTNRSKGDKDPALWMPVKDHCIYIQNWVAVKVKYSLTIDIKESEKLNSYILSCGLSNSIFPSPASSPTVTGTPTTEVTPTPTQNLEPTVSTKIVTPGAFCSPTGAIGKSSSGVTYTCKTSSTDSRNRWR
jgi:hypothetical protein